MLHVFIKNVSLKLKKKNEFFKNIRSLKPNAKQEFEADLLSLINHQVVDTICYAKYVEPNVLNAYDNEFYGIAQLMKDESGSLQTTVTFFNHQEVDADKRFEIFSRCIY